MDKHYQFYQANIKKWRKTLRVVRDLIQLGIPPAGSLDQLIDDHKETSILSAEIYKANPKWLPEKIPKFYPALDRLWKSQSKILERSRI